MSRKVAIIGDNFILPEMFEDALHKACFDHELDVRLRREDWPDTPTLHGYSGESELPIKEFLGDFEETVEFVGDAEIAIIHHTPITDFMLKELPQLKFIACSRGGPVNIDLNATKAHGVQVVRTPGRNASAVAEFTIGAILAETRNIRLGHETMRNGVWRGDLYRADTTGRELNELTVGVIGYGKIGTRLVKLLRVFGCRIMVSDPYVQLDPEDRAAGVEQVSLETLLAESDVVTLHPRVTEETTHMINKDTLAQMKRDALLVNTARVPLCNYDHLYDALVGGQIGAAMLETFATEPTPPDWPLLHLDNVTITPHIAGASVRTARYAAETLAQDVRNYLTGAPLNNLYGDLK